MNETESTACGAIGNELTRNEPLEEKPIVVSGIYGLRCKMTNKWYVGQSIDIIDRWHDYEMMRCKNQIKLYRALKKYGYDSFERILIEEINPKVDWIFDYREMYWIRVLNAIAGGYNVAEGGSVGISFAGRKHTEETKKKMSAWQIGRKHSPQRVENMKRALAKVPRKARTEESKQKIREKMLGRVFSEETKKKMREAKLAQSAETRMKISVALKERHRQLKLSCT